MHISTDKRNHHGRLQCTKRHQVSTQHTSDKAHDQIGVAQVGRLLTQSCLLRVLLGLLLLLLEAPPLCLLRLLEDTEPASELLDSELDESELESDSELDSEPLLESESEDDSPDDLEDRLRRFFDESLSPILSACLARAFSFSSNMRFAVPLLFLNSSGTSTEGFPSAFSFASTFGFSNCCVREGLETYGRDDLH